MTDVSSGVWLGKNQKEIQDRTQHLTKDGVLGGSIDGFTASGEIPVKNVFVSFGHPSNEITLTLPDGVDGQIIRMKAFNGVADITVTPDNFASAGTSLVFSQDDYAELIFQVDSWYVFITNASLA